MSNPLVPLEDCSILPYRPVPYATIANAINTLARPSQGWLRAVFEKPFGSDYDSALKMADDLSNSLTEKEIYRIDHYLGKQALQGIPELFAKNHDVWVVS